MYDYFFWFSSFIAVRLGLHAYTPGALALLCYLTASIGVLPVYFSLKNRTKIRMADVPRFIVVGNAGFNVYNIALNHGALTVSASITSFIVGLIPVFTVLLAVALLKEKMNLKDWLGVVSSFMGIICIVIGENGLMIFDASMIYNLITAISTAVYAVTQKTLFKRYSVLEVVSIGIWIGTFLMLIYVRELWHELPGASLKTTFISIYIGIFPGVIAYICWSYVLSIIPACQASTAIYTMPVVTTIIGYFYLHEVPSFCSLLGGLIVLIGAIIVNCHFSKKGINPKTQWVDS